MVGKLVGAVSANKGSWGEFGELTNWRIDPREVEELKNKKK